MKPAEIPGMISAVFNALGNGIIEAGITSGATAVVCYMHKSELFVGHSGDARAIIVNVKGDVKLFA